MPCVYHLLRSVARSIPFRLHILSAGFYKQKKKKEFNAVLTLNANFFIRITGNVDLIMQCFLKVTPQNNEKKKIKF